MARRGLVMKSTPFAGWSPDQSALAQGNREAKGVIHRNNKFEPMRSLTAYNSNARLADTCLGARGFYAQNGGIHLFFADRTRLYKTVSRVPTDVSKAGGYAADRDAGWCMEQFGDYIIATARGVSVPQVYQLGVSSQFSDLTGSPPAGDVCGRVKQFMLLGYDRTLSWSAFNDVTDWVPSLTTQAGSTELDQLGGSIMAISGGETGMVFQERKISRLTYVGPPTTWVIDEVEDKRGAISRRAVARFGRIAYYVSEDGFWAFDGLQSTPIGQGWVDQYFADNLNYSQRHMISAAIDTEKRCLIVAFPSGASSLCNELLIYSIADQKWSHDTIDTQMVFEMPREGVTADMATEIIGLVGTLDTDQITVSIDSPIFRENKKRWAAVDSAGIVSLFEGANRPAVLETATFEPVPGGSAYVNEIWPVSDAPLAGVTATLKSRANLLSDAVVTDVGSQIAEGFCPVRGEGRYVSVRIDIPAGTVWSEATGIRWTGAVGSAR